VIGAAHGHCAVNGSDHVSLILRLRADASRRTVLKRELRRPEIEADVPFGPVPAEQS
jgi:hypothetical protein